MCPAPSKCSRHCTLTKREEKGDSYVAIPLVLRFLVSDLIFTQQRKRAIFPGKSVAFGRHGILPLFVRVLAVFSLHVITQKKRECVGVFVGAESILVFFSGFMWVFAFLQCSGAP